MFSNNSFRSFICCALLTGAQFFSSAQTNPGFFQGALAENRGKLYKNTVARIERSLSLPLNKENEEAWISAFIDINSFKYEPAFVIDKIDFAAKRLSGRSNEFKAALLELLNSDFPKKYNPQVKNIFFNAAEDYRLMAMAATYILPTANSADAKLMRAQVEKQLKQFPDNVILNELNRQLIRHTGKTSMPSPKAFFDGDYLPGQVLVLSFQRADRNFPGLAIVRKADGSFLKNDDGTYFHIGQLARSESNMPGYISLGNTPQGIFRMDGFDTSKLFSIGPTTNIQLTIPFEYKASHFFRDPTIADSVFLKEMYAALLPESFRKYGPLFGTYHAGKAGRNEIIAHGTTIDSVYFAGRTYSPYSPSAGCLVTKEFWNPQTGSLLQSDQLSLTNAVSAAGGPAGYLLVIELDEKRSAVTIDDLAPYLP